MRRYCAGTVIARAQHRVAPDPGGTASPGHAPGAQRCTQRQACFLPHPPQGRPHSTRPACCRPETRPAAGQHGRLRPALATRPGHAHRPADQRFPARRPRGRPARHPHPAGGRAWHHRDRRGRHSRGRAGPHSCAAPRRGRPGRGLPDGDGVQCAGNCVPMPGLAPMLTAHDDGGALFDAMMAGAAGYVLKQIRGAGLTPVVRAVAAGVSVLDPMRPGKYGPHPPGGAPRTAGRADPQRTRDP